MLLDPACSDRAIWLRMCRRGDDGGRPRRRAHRSSGARTAAGPRPPTCSTGGPRRRRQSSDGATTGRATDGVTPARRSGCPGAVRQRQAAGHPTLAPHVSCRRGLAENPAGARAGRRSWRSHPAGPSVAFCRVDPRFAVDLPEGKSINPITGTNWEGVAPSPMSGAATGVGEGARSWRELRSAGARTAGEGHSWMTGGCRIFLPCAR